MFKFSRFQWAVHLGSWIPFVVLVWDYFHGNLTVNPIQAVEQRTGQIALTWLVFSLSCTPLNTLAGFRQAIKVRRALGLYAFTYAVLHFLTFFAWDYAGNIFFIWMDVNNKLYILVGALALLILIPIAITSTRWMMQKLGKRWKQLHRLVYPVSGLVVVHYIWSVKADIRLPLLYGAILLILIGLRWPPVRRWISRKRSTWTAKFRTSSFTASNPPAPEIK
jgi:methionine sulfoxide reductase heme-binding subunit